MKEMIHMKKEHRLMRFRFMEKVLTHITKLSWPLGLPEPIGFLPDNSSRRTTPKEYTSILSLTLPYMKYSGARYPKVPTTSQCVRKEEVVGPHKARPKSDNCEKNNWKH